MDGKAWWATVHGVTKSWTRLSDFTLLHLYWLTLMPSRHLSLRQGWFYFLILWVIPRTKGGCDDGENRYVTVPVLICFDHNGTIWKVSVGTGTMLLYWAPSATE